MLNELARGIYAANAAKGFWEDYHKMLEWYQDGNIPQSVITAMDSQRTALIAGEAHEAIEALRKEKRTSYLAIQKIHDAYSKGDEWKEDFAAYIKDSYEDEIADVLIRVLDACGGMGIDIQRHVDLKLAFNASRPAKHGKKF